jgi:hypothetical protein
MVVVASHPKFDLRSPDGAASKTSASACVACPRSLRLQRRPGATCRYRPRPRSARPGLPPSLVAKARRARSTCPGIPERSATDESLAGTVERGERMLQSVASHAATSVKPQAEANARTLSGGSATDSSALISFAYCRGSACARRCSCKATSPKRKLPYGDAEKCSVRKVNSRPFIAIGTRSNRVSARCGLYFPETEF